MELEARIDALEAELAELRQLARRPVRVTAPASDDEPTSRRHLLGRAGAVALGAAAGALAGASPAAANDPNDLTLGSSKNTAGLTGGSYSGAAAGASFMFQSGTTYAPGDADFNTALAGWASASSAVGGPLSGVYAYTEVEDSNALVVRNVATRGGGAYVVHGGEGPAVTARSNSGPALLLEAGGAAPPSMPPTAGSWPEGSLVRTTDGHLWYCSQGGSGSASRWVRLSGGGLNLLATPQRAFDTRPGAGPFEGTDTRTVGLRPFGVPVGAKGALLNLTVTDTSGYGYLQVYSADLGAPPATSNLNWFPGARILANSATSAVNAAGEIKLTSQGGIAQVIVDVFGYYD